MFRAHERWRHRSTTEIDIYIIHVSYTGPKYTKMSVIYLNRQMFLKENEVIDTRPEKVTVKREDFKNWKKVS